MFHPTLPRDAAAVPIARTGPAEKSGTSAAPALPYAVLAFVFIAMGLLGHDPWKADEAYVFGVVQHMLESSDWVIPRLAGEPFMEKPPLFYWAASACAWLFAGLLPAHDGARLASGFFMMLTCSALAATARSWWGAGAGRYAVLVLLACLGTLVQSHMMMPDVPLLTGFAVSALGFATVLARPRTGGVLLGLGIGTAFLSKGLIGPAVMGATALLLPACFRQWRTRGYWKGWAIAALVAAPALVIWPVLLYLRSPALFMDWFWVNNVGRFLGFSVPQLGTEHLPWFWTQTIPWFTFPGLPLALWTLWQKRASAWSALPVQFSVVAFGVLMLVLAVASSGRCVYGWPLLIPIALLAAQGARALPRRAEGCWLWAGVALFGLLSSAVWAGWAIMMATGAPPDWPLLRRVLPTDFVPRFDALALIVAALVTAGALGAARLLWHKPARGLTAWVIGLTLTWSLLTTLWLPWLDFAKSYRLVFASMPLPASGCVASINLGEGERAMLRYVTGRNPTRREVAPDASCKTLLVQREAAHGEPPIDRLAWRELWRGSRPGLTNERFWLFQLSDRADQDPIDGAESDWAASFGLDGCGPGDDGELCDD